MAKPMLSAATEEALSVIAHVYMADGIAKSVSGMEDFAKFYRSRMTRRDQKILARFENLCRQAHSELARLVELDGS